jgi:hypothetical protein
LFAATIENLTPDKLLSSEYQANTYNFLGSKDEGVSTICRDEVDKNSRVFSNQDIGSATPLPVTTRFSPTVSPILFMQEFSKVELTVRWLDVLVLLYRECYRPITMLNSGKSQSGVHRLEYSILEIII